MSEPTPPPETVDLVICRLAIAAYLATNSRRRGERFLKCMAELAASEVKLDEMTRIHCDEPGPGASRASREALVWLKHKMPVFLAKL
jgi:hypothetical protein